MHQQLNFLRFFLSSMLCTGSAPSFFSSSFTYQLLSTPIHSEIGILFLRCADLLLYSIEPQRVTEKFHKIVDIWYASKKNCSKLLWEIGSFPIETVHIIINPHFDNFDHVNTTLIYVLNIEFNRWSPPTHPPTHSPLIRLPNSSPPQRSTRFFPTRSFSKPPPTNLPTELNRVMWKWL